MLRGLAACARRRGRSPRGGGSPPARPRRRRSGATDHQGRTALITATATAAPAIPRGQRPGPAPGGGRDPRCGGRQHHPPGGERRDGQGGDRPRPVDRGLQREGGEDGERDPRGRDRGGRRRRAGRPRPGRPRGRPAGGARRGRCPTGRRSTIPCASRVLTASSPRRGAPCRWTSEKPPAPCPMTGLASKPAPGLAPPARRWLPEVLTRRPGSLATASPPSPRNSAPRSPTHSRAEELAGEDGHAHDRAGHEADGDAPGGRRGRSRARPGDAPAGGPARRRPRRRAAGASRGRPGRTSRSAGGHLVGRQQRVGEAGGGGGQRAERPRRRAPRWRASGGAGTPW